MASLKLTVCYLNQCLILFALKLKVQLFLNLGEESMDVHVVQTLTFSLGMASDVAHAQHHSMATICRMSRNVLFPPQYKTLHEWFHYAFSASEIDGMLPNLQ